MRQDLRGAPSESPLLELRDLTIEFPTESGWAPVVSEINLCVSTGETLGIVGESGSGKTMTALATMGLLPGTARVTGEIWFGGRDLRKLSDGQLRAVRGNEIGMIFQEPRRSLNPAFTVGDQIAEGVRRHRRVSRREAWDRAIEMLELVHIPRPEVRANDYPHRFSGGMCQRVMLAMALACDPQLLIADEPTTALDVTVQAQMLDLISDLQERLDIAVVFITHDLGVIARVSDRLAVMYAGQVVETGSVDSVFTRPGHPYTEGLLGSIPDIRHRDQPLGSIRGRVPAPQDFPHGCRFHPRCDYVEQGQCTEAPIRLRSTSLDRDVRCVRTEELVLTGIEAELSTPELFKRPSDDVPVDVVTYAAAAAPTPSVNGARHEGQVLAVRNLVKSFPLRRDFLGRATAHVHAARGVSLTLDAGRTLALVGESGAGKSTLGRLVLRLIKPDDGEVSVLGRDLMDMSVFELRRFRSSATMIFQDPYTSFDPKMTIGASVAEPLQVHTELSGRARRQRVEELLDRVGLTHLHLERYPYEMSGGQLQRASIARALTTQPRLIVCDEPVAALDMSIRSQVINLLRELQADLGIAYLFISHDLSLVRVIADDVAVMYQGEIVEMADADTLFEAPQHNYTKQLLAAVPVPRAGARQRSGYRTG